MKDSGELQFFNEIRNKELETYKNQYRSTLKEWKKYIKRAGNIDSSIVPSEVYNAWNRCRALGINPLKIPEKKILTGTRFAALLNRNSEFIEVSRPFLKNLYHFLRDSNFNVVLFDKEGYLLEILGDHDLADEIRYIGGVVGALWDESSAGHNTIGAILEEKKPIQIVGSQHYIKAYHCETGAGAPIFSPDGELLGGISLSARNPRFSPHTLGMAVAAAYAVENELLTRKVSVDRQRAYQFQKSVIGSVMEAILAIDNNGIISLINDPARNIFDLHDAFTEGQDLKSLLAGKNTPAFELIQRTDRITDKEMRIFSRNTWNEYTLTITPILSGDNERRGKIIVFNEIKRAKSMMTTMLGAHAVYRFEDICGKDPRFLIVMEQARTMAQNDSNVLLLGKSGTGKDIFAQSIHNASHRRTGPYIAINCAAIPRDLLASELFGHEEGAFTGALRGGHQGKFELADGGTIFLDEIAELPLEFQAVLLRVIEDKLVTRIGGKRTRKINVRIITATNKNLKEEIEKGRFREDLFYRINVFNIKMLPLCERPDDIPLLLHWFIKKFEDKLGKKIRHIDQTVMDKFSQYSWPGNVRELQNVIERMMNFASAGELTYDLIPEEILKVGMTSSNIDALKSPEEVERKMIIKMMELKFHKTQIAKQLDISRATLYRKIQKYRL
ncbi:MAG: sigma-54-dependent Fis family transcriptional regulator [Proteobacteria bacterium]|nr:sigma-54-dependent Fis family transcriptional regulator [Pseudomonadota bacterium]MBU2482282.1 sigma-54-dependent Fis family transcriptional regulator [Pseudomonadota bacterium]